MKTSIVKVKYSEMNFNMGRRKTKWFVCALMLVCIYNFFGIGDYMHTKSFDDDFDYPLNIDIKPLVKELLRGKKPSVKPINYYPFKFLSSWQCGRIDKIDLVILVKSAMDHFGHRAAIRQTYGQENLIPGRIVKTLFFVGIEEHFSGLQNKISAEIKAHGDVIQMDFIDSYYNNTIKTMMAFRWAFEGCRTADFYLFTDDDMYISVTNLLDYVNDQMEGLGKNGSRLDKKHGHLFSGYVFESKPQRFKSSKWWVSLEEYPWDKWPPYVTAGAYVVSNKSMRHLYLACLFVKHFKFDDIYLGIVAKKVGIEPIHCPAFHYYKKKYSKEGYRDVIASHGYSDHEELIRVWNEQNSISHS